MVEEVHDGHAGDVPQVEERRQPAVASAAVGSQSNVFPEDVADEIAEMTEMVSRASGQPHAQHDDDDEGQYEDIFEDGDA